MKVSLRVGFRRDDPVSPLDGVLRDCHEMGFDGIELMLDPRSPYGSSGSRGGGRGPWASESVPPVMREQLRERVRRLRALLPSSPPRHPPPRADPPRRPPHGRPALQPAQRPDRLPPDAPGPPRRWLRLVLGLRSRLGTSPPKPRRLALYHEHVRL